MASKAITQVGEDTKIKKGKQSAGRKPVLVIASVILLLGAGGGGAWYLSQPQDGERAQAKREPPVFVNLETFVVNLHSEHGDQHLQTNLTLKMKDAAAADLIKLHMPEVRDRLVLLLSSKAPAQITGVDGKKQLASELLAEITRPFGESSPEHAVQSVLFTSFVIQ